MDHRLPHDIGDRHDPDRQGASTENARRGELVNGTEPHTHRTPTQPLPVPVSTPNDKEARIITPREPVVLSQPNDLSYCPTVLQLLTAKGMTQMLTEMKSKETSSNDFLATTKKIWENSQLRRQNLKELQNIKKVLNDRGKIGERILKDLKAKDGEELDKKCLDRLEDFRKQLNAKIHNYKKLNKNWRIMLTLLSTPVENFCGEGSVESNASRLRNEVLGILIEQPMRVQFSKKHREFLKNVEEKGVGLPYVPLLQDCPNEELHLMKDDASLSTLCEVINKEQLAIPLIDNWIKLMGASEFNFKMCKALTEEEELRETRVRMIDDRITKAEVVVQLEKRIDQGVGILTEFDGELEAANETFRAHFDPKSIDVTQMDQAMEELGELYQLIRRKRNYCMEFSQLENAVKESKEEWENGVIRLNNRLKIIKEKEDIRKQLENNWLEANFILCGYQQPPYTHQDALVDVQTDDQLEQRLTNLLSTSNATPIAQLPANRKRAALPSSTETSSKKARLQDSSVDKGKTQPGTSSQAP